MKLVFPALQMKVFCEMYIALFPFINNLSQFYLNFLHVWVTIAFLFMFLYFSIRYLETLALAAITSDAVFLILLDQGYL